MTKQCSIGKVIVAINPYKDTGLYSIEEIEKYRTQRVDELEPHLYLIGKCELQTKLNIYL